MIDTEFDGYCDECGDPLDQVELLNGATVCDLCARELDNPEEPIGLDIEFIPDEEVDYDK